MSAQKTVVYIDAANIILSAERLHFPLDILKLVRHLKDKYRGAHIVYFTGNFKSKRAEFRSLARAGVELVYKEIYNEERKAKANCDVEIAHRFTLDVLLSPPERIVLVSGDGDFACLCDFAKEKNVEVRVLACDPGSCSRVVKQRQHLRVSFLVELGALISTKKEKPPAGT